MNASTLTGTRLPTSASRILRTEAGRNPHDRQLHDLVGELSTRSDDFRTRWGSHNVRHHGTGTKRFNHPVVGELTLAYEGLEMAAEPGLTLTIYAAEPGSASAERLQLLGSWAASNEDEHSAAAVRAASGPKAPDGHASSSPDQRPGSASPQPARCSTTATASSSTPATDERAESLHALVDDGAQIVIADLADLEASRTMAESVNALGDVDAVIHNAGVYTDTERNLTVDGHPRVIAVNVLAPYLLTRSSTDPPDSST